VALTPKKQDACMQWSETLDKLWKCCNFFLCSLCDKFLWKVFPIKMNGNIEK